MPGACGPGLGKRRTRRLLAPPVSPIAAALDTGHPPAFPTWRDQLHRQDVTAPAGNDPALRVSISALVRPRRPRRSTAYACKGAALPRPGRISRPTRVVPASSRGEASKTRLWASATTSRFFNPQFRTVRKPRPRSGPMDLDGADGAGHAVTGAESHVMDAATPVRSFPLAPAPVHGLRPPLHWASPPLLT